VWLESFTRSASRPVLQAPSRTVLWCVGCWPTPAHRRPVGTLPLLDPLLTLYRVRSSGSPRPVPKETSNSPLTFASANRRRRGAGLKATQVFPRARSPRVYAKRRSSGSAGGFCSARLIIQKKPVLYIKVPHQLFQLHLVIWFDASSDLY